MTRVAGVFHNLKGIPLTSPGIEVLNGGKLGPSYVLGRTHYTLYYPLEAEQLPYQAVMPSVRMLLMVHL
jgi:hypothetical protein